VTPRPIDSLRNGHVAAARSLLTRKGRAAASAFLVEGPHAVTAALESSRQQVRELFVTEAAAIRDHALVQAAVADRVAVHAVTERVLGSLCDTVTPQGVVAVVDTVNVDLATAVPVGSRLVVVLEQIADPGNAGAVIRTADAAGATAVITTAGSVDIWSGKSVRASAGSVFHLPIVTDVSAAAALGHLRAQGCSVLATAADGEHDLDRLIDDGRLASPTAWVFGNEAHGVSAEVRPLADRVVRIPLYGGAESLNLAVAAAICLYSSARAQRH
jgi:TrmH family RNA methyltransferase